MTIGLVDDSAFDRELIQNHLKSLGYTVQIFASAGEFLASDFLGSGRVLILDIVMPEMNGLELLKIIRQSHDQLHLPVVMLSALDSYDDVEESVKAGANEYMIKPLDFRLFDLRLKTHLNCQKMALELKEVSRKQQVQSMVEKYHHELLNPLTIASNSLYDLSQVFQHDSITVLKQAHDRIEETVKKIYKAYQKDL